jgi:hypothetical protein
MYAIPTAVLQVLGTEDFYEYLEKYGLQLAPQLERQVGRSLLWIILQTMNVLLFTMI